MSGFRKARAEQAALKIALYGPPGSGKTFTTLLLAEGLAARDGKRIAYVDTERGTDFYCKPVRERPVHPEAFDFDAIYTRSLMEVIKDVRSLDPAQYSVIVIDSITHLWEAARAAYAGKQTKIGTIPMQAWGAIKKPYKELLSILLSSPMHAFVLGRQGTDYATDEETDELKAIGFKMKAEGETAYEPHILLRMEAVKPRKTNALATIVAYAEKDRTGVLSGRSFADPTFDSICGPLLGLLGGKQAQIKSSDETASDDAEAIESAEHALAAQSEELMRTFSARIELCESAAALKKIGEGITPKIKSQMLPTDLASVREKYHRRMSALPDNGHMAGHSSRHETPGATFTSGPQTHPPHDPGTGEIAVVDDAVHIKQNLKVEDLVVVQPQAYAPIQLGSGPTIAATDAGAVSSPAPASKPKPNMQNDPTGEEAARQLAATLEKRAKIGTDAKLLDEAFEKAKGGAAIFKRWKDRLNAPDFARIKPHLKELAEQAAEADAGRE